MVRSGRAHMNNISQALRQQQDLVFDTHCLHHGLGALSNTPIVGLIFLRVFENSKFVVVTKCLML